MRISKANYAELHRGIFSWAMYVLSGKRYVLTAFVMWDELVRRSAEEEAELVMFRSAENARSWLKA